MKYIFMGAILCVLFLFMGHALKLADRQYRGVIGELRAVDAKHVQLRGELSKEIHEDHARIMRRLGEIADRLP